MLSDSKYRIEHSLSKYIQSGNFFKEVTSSPQALADAAWFVRHKKQIIKALTNKGNQAGKQEILDSLNNPSKNDVRRIVDPNGEGELP